MHASISISTIVLPFFLANFARFVFTSKSISDRLKPFWKTVARLYFFILHLCWVPTTLLIIAGLRPMSSNFYWRARTRRLKRRSRLESEVDTHQLPIQPTEVAVMVIEIIVIICFHVLHEFANFFSDSWVFCFCHS